MTACVRFDVVSLLIRVLLRTTQSPVMIGHHSAAGARATESADEGEEEVKPLDEALEDAVHAAAEQQREREKVAAGEAGVCVWGGGGRACRGVQGMVYWYLLHSTCVR
jgi:hypothetical protein